MTQVRTRHVALYLLHRHPTALVNVNTRNKASETKRNTDKLSWEAEEKLWKIYCSCHCVMPRVISVCVWGCVWYCCTSVLLSWSHIHHFHREGEIVGGATSDWQAGACLHGARRVWSYVSWWTRLSTQQRLGCSWRYSLFHWWLDIAFTQQHTYSCCSLVIPLGIVICFISFLAVWFSSNHCVAVHCVVSDTSNAEVSRHQKLFLVSESSLAPHQCIMLDWQAITFY